MLVSTVEPDGTVSDRAHTVKEGEAVLVEKTEAGARLTNVTGDKAYEGMDAYARAFLGVETDSDTAPQASPAPAKPRSAVPADTQTGSDAGDSGDGGNNTIQWE